jgi:hypothetical protein
MVARFGAPWLLFHRVDLHNELKRLAAEPRPGRAAAVKIHLLTEVVDLDLDGNLTLANGSQLRKDLIVVADGVRVCLSIPYSMRLYFMTGTMLIYPEDQIRFQGCW